VDTIRLHGAPKHIGDSLNHIGDAISVAVEDRMKSERFRTELITNVSHDLKTPLTSIINYTDLLAKEDCGNETAKEYIDVLSRQAVRLKKLTEDLLEVSKASSGTLSVSVSQTDAAELLTQAVGEYEERFSSRNLSVITELKEQPLWILADGRHLWRVFDNLLGNICKYAMPGTRVYLTAERIGGNVVLSFRNISENPIAVSAEELTERFVRGDASRHSEGSGLGLAIADSLCRVQGGALSLTVDGDLFKAVVTFAAADEGIQSS
jgi:signal transduction histidine kinase